MRKPKLKPLSDEFWNVLEIGFMPWQTMPGMTALIRGNREKGIFLMVQSDYPAFGEGNGIKYSLCPSDKVPEIADAIVKISNSFDGNGFNRIEDRFVEVETIEDVFTLPDGETVAPGDFVEVVYKPSFSESLISRVMMVSCIETPGLMYDTEGDYYNSKDIISARKLFAELDKIDEETTENVKRKWRDGGMTCRPTDWSRVFGTRIKPDKVEMFRILSDGVDTGFVKSVSAVGSGEDRYEEVHVFEKPDDFA